MEENQKLCRIIDEMTLFLLELGLNDVSFNIKKLPNKTILMYECDIFDMDKLKEIDIALKHKRELAFEMYGWELIGQGDMDHELELVSTLINYFTYYIKENKIMMVMVRYE